MLQARDEPPNHAMHRTKPALSLHRGVAIGGKLVVNGETASAGFAAEREAVRRAGAAPGRAGAAGTPQRRAFVGGE